MAASPDLRFDTGRLCLDLLATVGGRLSTSPVERLDGVARLVTWLHRTGLLPAGQEADVDAAWLQDFKDLRGRLHRIVHSELRGGQAAAHDIDELNRTAAARRPAEVLTRDTDGTLLRRLAEPVRCDRLLAVVAEDAIRLLGSDERKDLRICAGPTCDLVYLDTSRGRRRRWCSPAACGNRHYVAAHRARKAETA
ncbi:ABATE domain-containing protein [Streptomyces morookaense]|uniref:CGNR zinc finger domain-containing protein n=1 Tax=Streptomyces morookaense TaxID=1970 RepID=UPI0033FC88BE